MAVDEALLNLFGDSDTPILRLYRWNPSFSFGRFSKPEESVDTALAKRCGVSCVRRITGGGILVHGGDLSYSIVLPSSFTKKKGVKGSYRFLCRFLIRLYEKLGLNAEFVAESPKERTVSNVCLAGKEEYDILVDGMKIGGNAQRHTKNGMLQHGSIPLYFDFELFEPLFMEESGLKKATTLSGLGVKTEFSRLSKMAESRWSRPEWLRKRISLSELTLMRERLAKGRINTICEEALCPNIGECFSNNQATFLILGNICTRACTFCNVSKGAPLAPDPQEPAKIAETVKTLGLRYVVITSPTRDDLPDGGAEQFCKTVEAVKSLDESIRVELLIPDLHESEEALAKVANSGARIVGHNLETVPRLYRIRRGAKYERSLRVLERLHTINPDIATKSGIMLGLGEEDDEVLELMRDLLSVGCRLLSIGQYLAPSNSHVPVVEFVEPKRFDFLRDEGMKMGFRFIKSSPYTRSSYMAHEYLN